MRDHRHRNADNERRSPRGRLVAGLFAIAAVIALVVLLRGRSTAPPEPIAKPSETERAQAQSGPASPPRPANAAASAKKLALAGDGGAYEPFDPHDTPVVPPPVPTTPFPYPPGSQPLTEGVNPATTMKEDDPVDAASGIHCIFGPRIAVVHPPDPLVIDLEVQNKLGALLPIGSGVARFRTEKADPEKGPWIETPFVDDGSGKDIAAGDRKYTATLKPTSDQQATLTSAGTHLYVEVRFDAPNGLGGRKYVAVMQYSREPDAKVNGKYTESADDGSLVIGVGVNAQVAGEYRVIGSLYGGADAIAFASKSAHLEVGDGTIPLLFFGKILHDRGIDGPYQLRYVMLFQHAPPEEIPGDTIDPAYTTKPYKASSFSDKSYVPPAPSYDVVDMNSPSQKDKPPPKFSQTDRENLKGPTAPIKPDPTNKPPQPVPTGTK